MDQSILVLGLLVGVIVLAVIAEVLFHKFKVPEQIILLLIGVTIQYTGLISKTTESYLTQVAPILGTFVLGLIILDAGLGMKAYDILVRSPKTLAIASLEPIIEAAVFSVIMHYLLAWPWIYGAMLGALLSTTTNEVIVPLVRGSSLDEDTQNTLILTAAYNSVTAIVAFEVIFGIAQSASVNLGVDISNLILAFLSGIVIGLVFGFAWVFIALRRIRNHQYLITMAAAFGAYIVSQSLGGNGILSILLFGIVIGNYNESYRKVVSAVLYGTILGKLGEELKRVLKISNDEGVDNLRKTQKEITFVAKTFFFVFLGMIFAFSFRGVIIGVILSFVLVAIEFLNVNIVRPEANRKYLALIAPRGITPIILATTFYAYANSLANAPVPSTYLLDAIARPMNSIVFTIIFGTIAIAVLSLASLTGGKKEKVVEGGMVPVGIGEDSPNS